MYYFSVFTIFIFSAFFLPIGVIASSGDEIDENSDRVLHVTYDYERERIFQIKGSSMEPLGFNHNSYVGVIPASDFNVGDVIAFTCFHENCDGAYIKKIVRKNETCYWVEGRRDVWTEDGKRKQSLDSRTTYGWLCNDKINIIGTAFVQTV